MESFFSRYRNALALIVVLLAQVVGLAVQVRRPDPNSADKGSVRLIRSWVVGAISPPERLLHGTGHGIRGMWTNYIDLIHVRRQNKELKAELDRLRLEQDSLAEDARQGERLQALLGFREKYVYKTVAAQVIGTSGTEQSQVLLIDKGSEDGIKPDLPVITPDGIVGKTRDVFKHTSQVLEISDATSGAGVILEKTRIRGVLRGDTWGQPEIVNVSPDERIQKGEAVVTSGGDAIYPRGLAVGTVERVAPDPDGTLVNVMVKPAANLSRLEEVLVITSTGDQMPQEMEQDLSEAQQKASDVLADRLPSRVDPNAPADEQQDPADDDAGGDVARPVRPPQAVHPDRYSPADTPPANALVPGQRTTDAEGAAANSGDNGAKDPASPAAAPAAKSGGDASTTAAPKAAGSAVKPRPKTTPAAAEGDQKQHPPKENQPATPTQTTPAPGQAAPAAGQAGPAAGQATPPQGGA